MIQLTKKARLKVDNEKYHNHIITVLYARDANRFKIDYNIFVDRQDLDISIIRLLDFDRSSDVLNYFFYEQPVFNRTLVYSLDRYHILKLFKVKHLIKENVKNIPIKLDYKTYKISDRHKYQDCVINTLEYDTDSLKAKLEALTVNHDSSIFREFVVESYKIAKAYQAKIIRELKIPTYRFDCQSKNDGL